MKVGCSVVKMKMTLDSMSEEEERRRWFGFAGDVDVGFDGDEDYCGGRCCLKVKRRVER